MILLLQRNDFHKDYISLVENIFNSGIDNGRYLIMKSNEFATKIVYALGLQQDPFFNTQFDQKQQYQKIEHWVNTYPTLMYKK